MKLKMEGEIESVGRRVSRREKSETVVRGHRLKAIWGSLVWGLPLGFLDIKMDEN